MKKLLSLIAIAVLGLSTSFAQTTVTVPVSKQTAKKVAIVKTQAPTVKKEVKKVETKTVAKKVATTNAAKKAPKAVVTKLKADGTPDMRYTENKAKKVVVAGPKKKDGTADMRYKVNKATVKKN